MGIGLDQIKFDAKDLLRMLGTEQEAGQEIQKRPQGIFKTMNGTSFNLPPIVIDCPAQIDTSKDAIFMRSSAQKVKTVVQGSTVVSFALGTIFSTVLGTLLETLSML